MTRVKPYSEFSFAIDLVMEQYKISNPILIAEKVEEDLGIEMSINQISDYLQLNSEDWEIENQKQQYYNEYY